jgi:hypothetical protein
MTGPEEKLVFNCPGCAERESKVDFEWSGMLRSDLAAGPLFVISEIL